MTTFFQSLFHLFLSPFGLVALAALDSSMLFFLPIAVDAAVVILSAQHHNLFWAYPLIATLGSLIGASATFWVGEKIGEKSLENWVSERKLEPIRRRLRNKGAIAMAVPAILPPPFPLTPFILACGALSVSRARFLSTLGVMRILRYGVLSLLGWAYGKRIVGILESPSFKQVVAAFMLLACIGTAYTAYRLIKNTRRGRLTRVVS